MSVKLVSDITFEGSKILDFCKFLHAQTWASYSIIDVAKPQIGTGTRDMAEKKDTAQTNRLHLLSTLNFHWLSRKTTYKLSIRTYMQPHMTTSYPFPHITDTRQTLLHYIINIHVPSPTYDYIWDFDQHLDLGDIYKVIWFPLPLSPFCPQMQTCVKIRKVTFSCQMEYVSTSITST